MSNCWRCGKALAHGQVECEAECNGASRTGNDFKAPSDEQVAQAWRSVQSKCALIDWDKVKSFEDLKVIMAATWCLPLYFPGGIPEAIKPFLKEQQ